jgi:hypothetical protein
MVFVPAAVIYAIASAIALWPRQGDQPKQALRRWSRMHLYILALILAATIWAFLKVYVIGG